MQQSSGGCWLSDLAGCRGSASYSLLRNISMLLNARRPKGLPAMQGREFYWLEGGGDLLGIETLQMWLESSSQEHRLTSAHGSGAFFTSTSCPFPKGSVTAHRLKPFMQ